MSVLQVNELVKSFGRRRVVDGVSLTIHSGEVVGLLGPNGAGKTTTFRMICGLLKPDSGSVTLSGTDVTQWPLYERARNGGMGYLPQQSSVFAKLTVRQNLLAMMQLLKMDRETQKNRCEELLERFKITKLSKARAGSLSGGERRRLEIARCLVSEPEIIMLDEPFAGIDPVTVQGIQEVIRELAQTGISILITDHAAREILQLTDRTYVVSDGKILCSGTTAEIVRHNEVKRKYLGEIDIPETDNQTTRAPDQSINNPKAMNAFGQTKAGSKSPGENKSTDVEKTDFEKWKSSVPRPDKPRLRVPRPSLPDTLTHREEIVAPFDASDLE